MKSMEWIYRMEDYEKEYVRKEAARLQAEWAATLDGLYMRPWAGGMYANGSKLVTYARVENDVVTEAWVDAPGGQGSGYAGNYVGMSREDLVAVGFYRQDVKMDYDETCDEARREFVRNNLPPAEMDERNRMNYLKRYAPELLS
ncbi:MAG: hypothetical protein WC455_19140 [Dehalococcoidia bacterium]|jgi:hypothetical protein